jgi:hypothetical protein
MDFVHSAYRSPLLLLGRWTLGATVLLAASAASASHADREGAEAQVGLGEEGRVTAERHPFAFLEDPSTPSAGIFAAGYTFGLGLGTSVERPIPMALEKDGMCHTL